MRPRSSLALTRAGGWGNAGGGVVFIVQTALFSRLVNVDGVTPHNAWRACFAVRAGHVRPPLKLQIIPVPLLLLTAAATLLFGTDHPTGRWSARHTTPATAIAMIKGGDVHLDRDERRVIKNKQSDKEASVSAKVSVVAAAEDDKEMEGMVTSGVDTAVNEVLTVKKALKIMSSPYTRAPPDLRSSLIRQCCRRSCTSPPLAGNCASVPGGLAADLLSFFASSFANTLFAVRRPASTAG